LHERLLREPGERERVQRVLGLQVGDLHQRRLPVVRTWQCPNVQCHLRPGP
jgi:hypothetical protein